MSSRAALEAALQARWHRDDLAVYADLLIGEGDPRGELIAYDLHHAPATRSQRHASERVALIGRWLGPELASGAADHVELGFLALTAVELELVARAGGHIRSVDAAGSARELHALCDELAAQPLPWLRTLALCHTEQEYVTDDLDLAPLFAAAPQLAELAIDTARMFTDLRHPAVHALHIAGAPAAHFGGHAVTSLDLAFVCFGWTPEQFELPDLVAADLPALRELDLSRNERGFRAPTRRGGLHDPIAWLAAQPILGALEVLRLPSLATVDAVASMVELLPALPALRELSIARGYAEHRPLLAPLAAAFPALVQATPWPWPDDNPPDQWIAVVYDGVAYRAQPYQLASLMEDAWSDLPADVRAAWTTLWHAIAAGQPTPLRVDELDLALDAVADDSRLDQLAILQRAIVTRRATDALGELAELIILR